MDERVPKLGEALDARLYARKTGEAHHQRRKVMLVGAPRAVSRHPRCHDVQRRQRSSSAPSVGNPARLQLDPAVHRDEKDAYSHFALAMTQVFLGNFVEAVRASEKAIELSPSFALAHVGLGMALLYSGKPEEAIEPVARGLRLNPFDPQNSHWFRIQALALYFSGQKEEALSAAHRALKARPGWPLTLETAAICHVALGQLQEAQACLEQMRNAPAPKGDPTTIMRKRNPKWAAEMAAQLRKAAAA